MSNHIVSAMQNMSNKLNQTPCYHCWLCLHDGISHISQVILAKTRCNQIQCYFG